MKPIEKEIENVLNQAQVSIEREENFHFGMEFILFLAASLFALGFVLDPSKKMSELDILAMTLWFFGVVWFVSIGVPVLFGMIVDWWRKG